MPLLASVLTCASPALAADSPLAGAHQDSVIVDEKTEAVIKGALRWMASRQNANGSWTSTHGEAQEIAMTGYALMAFMSAGQLPDEGEFGRNVTSGMLYLVNSIKANGTYGPRPHYMYGHGIATIALAELYGQTRDVRIRPKLELAVKLIVGCQNREGGWRYNPTPTDADISVTVLQAVALRAAKNAGLDVPQATLDRAVAYVRSCYDEHSGGFTYQPRNRAPGFARTAAAIYSLQVCGQYEDPRVRTGSQYLLKARQESQWYTYGHFYAAPAQYMIGGDTWKQWYETTSATLLKQVQREGDLAYWRPFRDGSGGVSPIYCTAVYTMVLAMPYHYVPLYQR